MLTFTVYNGDGGCQYGVKVSEGGKQGIKAEEGSRGWEGLRSRDWGEKRLRGREEQRLRKKQGGREWGKGKKDSGG